MRYFDTGDLSDFAQQTAEAMSAVLNLQITVVDEEARCVAGTGCFSSNVNKNLPAGYVFKKVIETGQAMFVDNPGKSPCCEECLERGVCREKASLLVPVRVDEAVIGGIGLGAETLEEKDRLVSNIDNYIRFMSKMACLLAAEVRSHIEYSKNAVLTDNLNTIIESYPYGIMMIDRCGVVTHFNRNAELILNVAASSMIGRQYSNKISCEVLERALSKGEAFRSVKAVFKVDCQPAVLILSVKPVLKDKKVEKAVCFFRTCRKEKQLRRAVQDSVRYSQRNIKGESAEIRQVLELTKKISRSNSTVLITGESGTGKELFARAIHYESSRCGGPFVAINCSAIPDDLLESELFGYSKGAFTSASARGKIGKFELADGGTIFLDEIGDMPVNLQAKLLRVLQEKKIERLGDLKSIDVDIRIIAATNRNLRKLVDEGMFREDLYYRLNVIPLKVPPLRRRKEDIPILAEHFMEKYSTLMLKNIKGFLPETLSVLRSYDWPGNIRELENTIEYAVNMENGEFIHTNSLPFDVVNGINQAKKYADDEYMQTALDNMERNKLKEMLLIYGSSTQSKKMIAQKLNMSLSTLYRKLKRMKEIN